MKFSCKKQDISGNLGIASRIISSRINIPIASAVLIKATKKKVIIRSTNFEISSKVEVPAQVEEEGEIACPAKTLSDFVNSLPEGNVEFTATSNILSVKGSKSFSEFTLLNAADFPEIIPSDKGEVLEIEALAFSSAVNYVSFAAAKDDVRPVLTGVLVRNSKKGLEFAAIDGLRLARYFLKSVKLEKEIQWVIPVSCMNEVIRVVSDKGVGKEDKICITDITEENQISFKYKGVEILARLLEGVYPDYEAIIPDDYKTQITLEQEALEEALKISNIFARSDAGNKMEFSVEEGSKEVEIRSKIKEIGKNVTKVKANVVGESVEFALQGRFVSDVLQHTEGKKIQIEVTSPGAGITFKIPNKKSYLYIAMPLVD